MSNVVRTIEYAKQMFAAHAYRGEFPAVAHMLDDAGAELATLQKQIGDLAIANTEVGSINIDLRERVEQLRGFVNKLFEVADWPEGGDIDMFEFQEAAEKYGLLIPETRFKPCEEGCFCDQMCTDKEFQAGVRCLRKVKWLTQDGAEDGAGSEADSNGKAAG